ncbi:MAG: sugar ABC transporter substrate-binding protein [Planctomycetia bacterium]|nr:sugar ABC transporter substrate-binding protein [Planctomycetia bacterium]
MKPLHWIGLVSLLLIGCGDGAKKDAGPKTDGKKPPVAFITNNPEAFWNIAEIGANKAAKQFNVDLSFIKPSSGDASVQKEKIDEVLNQGVKALAISVIDPKNQTNYLRSVAKKTILLTQDNDAPECGRQCYIGTDNYAAGRAAGALVKQAMPEGGTIVIFVGQIEPLNARQRRQGVLDELSGEKDTPSTDGAMLGKSQYKLYKTFTDQPEGATRAKENAVQALSQLGGEEKVCMVGLWAYNPPAILSAVKDQGKLGKIKIVGFDEDPATLNGIKDGHVYGTIVQQPHEFGFLSVKLMSELARGDTKNLPKDGMLPVPHLAVTRDGKDVKTTDGASTAGREVKAFHIELNKMLGKE